MILKSPILKNLSLNNDVGVVFTPEKWAKWLLKRYSIVDKWLSGKTVFDPTCGEGYFLNALVDLALEKKKIEELPLDNLYGADIKKNHIQTFLSNFKEKYNRQFPFKNLFHNDVILDDLSLSVDILIGNPPWQNFADLPNEYKKLIKPSFVKYGLARSNSNLLLGSSRIDISSLVVFKCISNNLKYGGEALFFLPLSLFLNEGAHKNFRNFSINETLFSVDEIIDFNGLKIFHNVSTRYGCAHFSKDQKTRFPIKYFLFENDKWIQKKAAPLFFDNDPFSIFSKDIDLENIKTFKIQLEKSSTPRQGVNTCGANNVFIFKEVIAEDDFSMLLVNKHQQKVRVPKKYVYPLIDNKNFNEDNPKPKKYILLLYNKETGRPIPPEELNKYKELNEYFKYNEQKLKERSGTFLKSWTKDGRYWACLGVGKYNFYKYKVAWQSFGTKIFYASIFSSYEGQEWQGNQAMHAYIPCKSYEEALVVKEKLNSLSVRVYLESFNMTGTKSWAQPGKLKRLIEFTDQGQLSLF